MTNKNRRLNTISGMEKLEPRQLMAFSAHVNFQPSGVSTPGGYVSDTGSTYAGRNGLTYGWDAANSSNTRDRNASNSADQRYDTLIHTQKGGSRKWEIAVPNGTYSVHLVAGDAGYNDSVYKFSVEGVQVLSGTPTSSNRWIEGTKTVSVSDGKLTLTNASGASNNKICHIDIASSGDTSIQSPPAAPTNLFVSAVSSTSLKLSWTDGSVREDGYKIERSTDGKTYTQIATVGVNVAAYTNTGLTTGKKYYYRVRAYNGYGNSPYTNTASGTPSSSSGTFQPKPLSWFTKASTPLRREESHSIVYNGKLYSIGGYIDDYVASREIDVYDPVANKWTRKNDMPSGYNNTHAAVAKGPDGHTFWFVGGFLGDFQHTFGGAVGPPATALVYKYDAATDRWTKGPSLPKEHGAGGAGIINNKLYFFGGADKTRTKELNDTYVLDLNNQSNGWERIASLPNPRNHLGGIVANGYLYAIGGQVGIEETAIAQSEVDRFDPSTKTWTKVASLPKPASHFNASEVVYDRYIITLGGENPHGVAQPWVFAYDTMNNKWAQMTSLPEARRAGIAGLVGTKLIFASGYLQSKALTATAWSTDLAGIFA